MEEARSAGAEQRAPYEYTLAKEHLDKAMSEAAEADYGDAYTLANAAYDYADQAVQRCSQNAGQSECRGGQGDDAMRFEASSKSLGHGSPLCHCCSPVRRLLRCRGRLPA